MKRILLSVGAAALVAVAFGYPISVTSSPDATATSSATASSGWSSGVKKASASQEGDFRQMSIADSILFSGKFKSTPPTGVCIIIR